MTLRSLYRRLNEGLAVRVVLAVATMECVYVFAALALMPLFVPGTMSAVQFISSGFLQLVLLPLILVGQALLGRNAEEQRKQDHEMILEELRLHREELALMRRIAQPMGFD